jgi:hypothetical protein
VTVTEDEIIAAIRAELRPGGHPAQVYLDLGAIRNVNRDAAAALTTAILLNHEDRLVQLETTDA